jgi:hypothetical protein
MPLVGRSGRQARAFVPTGTNGRMREEVGAEHNVAHDRGAFPEPSHDCPNRLLTGNLW